MSAVRRRWTAVTAPRHSNRLLKRLPQASYCTSKARMAKNLIPGDKTIKTIQPGDPRGRLSDGDGLFLLLFVKGGAHGWRFDYSHGGKRKTLSLGTYPDTTLAAARTRADEFRKLVAAGTGPSHLRKASKAQQQASHNAAARHDQGLSPAGGFEAVAHEWIETVHQHKVSPGHAARTLIRLAQDVFPWIGRAPITALEAPALLEVLRGVEACGPRHGPHRTGQHQAPRHFKCLGAFSLS